MFRIRHKLLQVLSQSSSRLHLGVNKVQLSVGRLQIPLLLTVRDEAGCLHLRHFLGDSIRLSLGDIDVSVATENDHLQMQVAKP